MVRIEVRGVSPYNNNTFSVVVEEESAERAHTELFLALKDAKESIRNSLGE